ncbi:MAG: ABC transporter permease [Planctomycetes bacterium]|nr:ABC transporter permease [Planctomycetota bacterium]
MPPLQKPLFPDSPVADDAAAAAVARAAVAPDLADAGFQLDGERRRRWWQRTLKALSPGFGGVLLLFLLWEAVVASGWRPEWVLPSPTKVLGRVWNELFYADTWIALRITMQRALLGYLIALAVGVALGLAMVRLKWLRGAFGGFTTGLQTMPSIVWFPFAILLFQLGEGAILFVVVLGAAPSIANGLLDAVDQIPPLLVKVGRSLGARGFSLYRRVVIPAALPGFVNGLKQGWAFSWRSLMAGELLVIIGDRPSVGTRLHFARELADAEGLMAWMVVVLAIGLLVHALGFGLAEQRMMSKRGLLGAQR